MTKCLDAAVRVEYLLHLIVGCIQQLLQILNHADTTDNMSVHIDIINGLEILNSLSQGFEEDEDEFGQRPSGQVHQIHTINLSQLPEQVQKLHQQSTDALWELLGQLTHKFTENDKVIEVQLFVSINERKL